MATLMLCVGLAVAALAPETIIGRILRRLLIELPAEKLNQARSSHLAAGLVALGVAFAIIAHAKTEGMMMAAQGLPEGLGCFAMFDVATYVDAMILLMLLAAAVRLRIAYDVLRASAAKVKRWMRQFTEAVRVRQGRSASWRAFRNRSGAQASTQDQDRGWLVPSFA